MGVFCAAQFAQHKYFICTRVFPFSLFAFLVTACLVGFGVCLAHPHPHPKMVRDSPAYLVGNWADDFFGIFLNKILYNSSLLSFSFLFFSLLSSQSFFHSLVGPSTSSARGSAPVCPSLLLLVISRHSFSLQLSLKIPTFLSRHLHPKSDTRHCCNPSGQTENPIASRPHTFTETPSSPKFESYTSSIYSPQLSPS